MKNYEVQSIEIQASLEDAVRYISDASKLPEWTSAFHSVRDRRATMVTPSGAIDVDLDVDLSPTCGSIDWTMTFPDKTVARAFSRVVPVSTHRIVYVFVLTTPPSQLEELEGALDRQSEILHKELARLKQVLEQ